MEWPALERTHCSDNPPGPVMEQPCPFVQWEQCEPAVQCLGEGQ